MTTAPPPSPDKKPPAPPEKKPTTTPDKKPPPTAAAPPRKKKKGGGCLLRLILLALVAAATAAVYYAPRQVEKITGITLPDFLPHAGKDAAKPASASTAPKQNTAAEKPSATITRTAPAPTTRASAATEEAVQTLMTRVQQLQRQADIAKRQQQETQARLTQTEQQLARLAAQQADWRTGNDDQLLRLQVVALQLRVDGDTAAAAAALRDIAAVSSDTRAARLMMDEAARLEVITPRAVLLSLLDELQQSAQPPATEPSAADDIIGQLKTLFNVRHTPSAAALPLAETRLERLRLLLVTGREDVYWLALQRMRADGGGAAAARAVLQRLHEHGAPDYHVRLDL